MSGEEILTEGVIRKRNEAIRALYDQYAPVLLGVCCRYCENREDAEDVLQEGFIKIIGNISGFKPNHNGSLLSWMKRIMANTALNQIRCRHKILVDTSSLPPETETGEADDPFPFSLILGKLSQEEILGMITSLPPGYRAVFNLYVFEGFSHKEIADALNCSESTSKSQLSKARALLRHKIAETLQNGEKSEYGKAQASYR